MSDRSALLSAAPGGQPPTLANSGRRADAEAWISVPQGTSARIAGCSLIPGK